MTTQTSLRKNRKYSMVENDNELTLYSDQFIRVTSKGIYLKRYYTPFGWTKFIPFHKIENINFEPVSLWKSKINGMGLSTVWWATDWKRPFNKDKRRFMSITVKGECIRKGFSCVDSAHVISLVHRQIYRASLKM